MIRLLVGLAPACVALAWLPLRDRLPNTDLALVLVVVIAGVGFVAGRPGALMGALGAGVTFDLLHTRPYGHLAITHGRDVLTTAFLVVAGVAMGEVALRLARYRRVADSEADAFALVTDAAGLIATGGESRLVIEALSEELARGLKLLDCQLETGPPKGDVPFIARDGSLVRLDESGSRSPEPVIDLPVWTSGEIAAHFRLCLGDEEGLPSKAQLRLAVSVADQAGAALSVRPPTPPPDEPRQKKLRLVRG